MKKYLIFIGSLLILFSPLSSQSDTKKEIGKIIYLEGKVELKSSEGWNVAKINDLILNTTSIKTAPGAIAEIKWENGTSTSVEPESLISAEDVYKMSSSNAVAKTESIFSRFKNLFKSTSDAKRAEEGGIRRSKAIVDSIPGENEVYWKEIKEVSYNDASYLYERGNYPEAIWAFKSFLDQKPLDPMAKYAMFALGHSYILVNNQPKAREVFEKFVIRYSNDELKPEAELVLSALPSIN